MSDKTNGPIPGFLYGPGTQYGPASPRPTPEPQEAAPQAQDAVDEPMKLLYVSPEEHQRVCCELEELKRKYAPLYNRIIPVNLTKHGYSGNLDDCIELYNFALEQSRLTDEFLDDAEATVAQLRAELHETRQLQIEEMDLCERAREAAEASNAQLRAEIANAAEFIKVVRETCFDELRVGKVHRHRVPFISICCTKGASMNPMNDDYTKHRPHPFGVGSLLWFPVIVLGVMGLAWGGYEIWRHL